MLLTWKPNTFDIIAQRVNTIYRNVEVTPAEKYNAGHVRDVVVLDRSGAVRDCYGKSLLQIKVYMQNLP
jgi:hypothetical protein